MMLQAIGIGGASGSVTSLCSVRCRENSKPRPKGKGKTVKVVKIEEGKQGNGGGFGQQKKKEPLWHCVKGCGACCKLAKDPTFATPEEIFDNPSDIQHYKSLIGADGWCIHYDKSTRTCSIYDDRPFFCRVEPDVFHMESTRRDSTRRLAVAVMTQSKQFMDLIQKSWRGSTSQFEVE